MFWEKQDEEQRRTTGQYTKYENKTSEQVSEQAESTNNTKETPKNGGQHSVFFVAARRITKRKIKHQQTHNNKKTEKTILRVKYNRPTDHGRYNEG